MKTPLQRRTISRLANILGLLGSDQPGERASAALAAHRLVSRLGVSWTDLLQPAPVTETKVVVRRVRDYDLDQQAAAEARMRQLKSTNERLEKEVVGLRRRLAAIAERQRQLAMAEADDEV